MRVAIVCDWLVTYAGAERVVEQMLKVFPDADLFAVFRDHFFPISKVDPQRPSRTASLRLISRARG